MALIFKLKNEYPTILWEYLREHMEIASSSPNNYPNEKEMLDHRAGSPIPPNLLAPFHNLFENEGYCPDM